jgi:hypothetical protein
MLPRGFLVAEGQKLIDESNRNLAADHLAQCGILSSVHVFKNLNRHVDIAETFDDSLTELCLPFLTHVLK